MRGERVPQRMRRNPAAEPRRLSRHVADAVELAHRYWPERVLAGNSQPFDRHCNHHARSNERNCGDSMACLQTCRGPVLGSQLSTAHTISDERYGGGGPDPAWAI